MRILLAYVLALAALSVGWLTHRFLSRVAGLAEWHGKVGWITGQALAGGIGGLLASLPFYFAMRNAYGAVPGISFSVSLSAAILVTCGAGVFVAVLYALTHDREELLEELAAEDRIHALRRVRAGDTVESVKRYLEARVDLEQEASELAYRLGSPIEKPSPHALAAERAILEEIVELRELPEALRNKAAEALTRVKARQRHLGYGSDDAA